MTDSQTLYLVEKWDTPETNSYLQTLFSDFWKVKSLTIARLNRYLKNDPRQLIEYETHFTFEDGKKFVIHDMLDGGVTLNGEKVPSYHFAESKIAEVCQKLPESDHRHAD